MKERFMFYFSRLSVFVKSLLQKTNLEFASCAIFHFVLVHIFFSEKDAAISPSN